MFGKVREREEEREQVWHGGDHGMAGMDMAMPYCACPGCQGGGKMLEGTKGQGKIKCKSKFGQSTI